MKAFGNYAQRADCYYCKYDNSRDLFKISDVNSDFLKEHDFNCTVAAFKKMVRKQKPYDFVLTGNACISMRKTAIYRISNLKCEVTNEAINI